METITENKAFIQDYFNSISGVNKTPELVSQFTEDQELLNHIAFFDAAFPKYKLHADEITAEENRVVVRARIEGKHEGEFNGIPPTFKEIEIPFVIGYEIENSKIVNHWMVADQLQVLELLGVKDLGI